MLELHLEGGGGGDGGGVLGVGLVVGGEAGLAESAAMDAAGLIEISMFLIHHLLLLLLSSSFFFKFKAFLNSYISAKKHKNKKTVKRNTTRFS